MTLKEIVEGLVLAKDKGLLSMAEAKEALGNVMKELNILGK